MTLTFVTERPCGLCGHRERGVMVYSRCRVNKASIVTGDGFGCVEGPTCRECGWPRPDGGRVRLILTADDKAQVDAYRQRKGWAA